MGLVFQLSKWPLNLKFFLSKGLQEVLGKMNKIYKGQGQQGQGQPLVLINHSNPKFRQSIPIEGQNLNL